MTRPLRVIAAEIANDWQPPSIYAVQQLRAMLQLDSIYDMYGADQGSDVVASFLANAQSWKGPVARRVKLELKHMLHGGAPPDFRSYRKKFRHSRKRRR